MSYLLTVFPVNDLSEDTLLKFFELFKLDFEFLDRLLEVSERRLMVNINFTSRQPFTMLRYSAALK